MYTKWLQASEKVKSGVDFFSPPLWLLNRLVLQATANNLNTKLDFSGLLICPPMLLTHSLHVAIQIHKHASMEKYNPGHRVYHEHIRTGAPTLGPTESSSC